MNWRMHSHIAVVLTLCGLAGCAFNTHGNREDKRRQVTQAGELPHFVGKEVTLVGTARTNDALRNGSDEPMAAIDLRGGSVMLPAYEWPAGYAGQPVAVTGTLFEQRLGVEYVQYRLGEIRGAERWSR
jgi:hypothetical protein